MHKHPSVGRRILRSVPFLSNAAEVVYAHHERYDGSGYPRGLQGDQIPLAARVFAVADVLDALTSARPYRSPVDWETAQSMIRDEAGKQFDPVVVEAFTKVSTLEWERIRDEITGRSADLSDSVAGIPG